jgi:hypothetical protein
MDTPPAPDAGGDAEATPPSGGDTDFNADANMGGDDANAGDNAGGDQNGDGNNEGPGVDYESMRKYNLFKEYINLMTALDIYVERLKLFVLDDVDQNVVVNTCVDKLLEIKKLCSDYLLMKYELATYIQSLIFYQKLVVSIQLVFGLLEKIDLFGPQDEEERGDRKVIIRRKNERMPKTQRK